MDKFFCLGEDSTSIFFPFKVVFVVKVFHVENNYFENDLWPRRGINVYVQIALFVVTLFYFILYFYFSLFITSLFFFFLNFQPSLRPFSIALVYYLMNLKKGKCSQMCTTQSAKACMHIIYYWKKQKKEKMLNWITWYSYRLIGAPMNLHMSKNTWGFFCNVVVQKGLYALSLLDTLTSNFWIYLFQCSVYCMHNL